MRKGLAEWQSYLLGKSLPIFKQTMQDVQRLIDQPQLSVTQYVGPILFDPAFTMQVFKFVNSQRVSVKKHPLTTLDSALSLLGQTAFQSLLNEMQLLEKIKLPKKNKRGYKRTASYACNAALQMKSWGIERNVLHVQEIQLATLLQSNVELLLWCYGEDVMPEIEKRCYVDKKSYQQAAQEVLGCDIKELGLVLQKNGICLKCTLLV